MFHSAFLRSYRHIVVAVLGRIAEKCQLSWLRLIWCWRCDQSNKNRKHISIVSVVFGDDSPRESDQLICGSFIACKSRTNTKFIHFFRSQFGPLCVCVWVWVLCRRLCCVWPFCFCANVIDWTSIRMAVVMLSSSQSQKMRENSYKFQFLVLVVVVGRLCAWDEGRQTVLLSVFGCWRN